MLPRQSRLNLESEFKIFKKSSNSLKSPLFTLLWRPSISAAPRVGFVVSNKIGIATVRNRIRRVLREVFRANLAELPPQVDFIIIANPNTQKATSKQLQEELKNLLTKVYQQNLA